MNRPSGLGKGLGALIPSDVSDAPDSTYQHISVSSIRTNPYQPREHFDEERLDSLASSVRELGVLQPLLVRRDGDGFELIAGERRLRAAKRAGLQDIPCIVREADDTASLEQALVENLHRQDLNALEEAAAYQQLIDDFQMTQQQVAKRVGKSRSAVANTVRLLGLPMPVQRLVADAQLSAGHARALLALEDPDEQVSMANRVITDDLNVRQIESLIRGDAPDDAPGPPDDESATSSKKPTRQIGSTKDPSLLELERLLADRFSTSVNVAMGAKRGKITIDFADLDDLERIFTTMIN